MQKLKMKEPVSENKTAASLVTFTSAFALGALLSYFATPAGKKTWRKLAKEWETARQELFNQGLIPDAKMSLDEFRENYVSLLSGSLQGLKESCQGFLDLSKQVLQEKKDARKKRKKFTFKGV